MIGAALRAAAQPAAKPVASSLSAAPRAASRSRKDCTANAPFAQHLIFTFRSGRKHVAVAFSPDGRQLAIAGENIQLLDLTRPRRSPREDGRKDIIVTD
jgi:hypothetical protein